MLSYLNPQTLRRFGTLTEAPREGIPFPVSQGDTAWRYQSTESVTLWVSGGMAILSLWDKEEQSYYLDRAICLSPEVAFAVFPLDADCQIFYTGAIERTELLIRGAFPQIRSKIVVERLETLTVEHRSFLGMVERHRPYTLVAVQEGQLSLLLEGQSFSLQAGESVIIPPEKWYLLYTRGTEEADFLCGTFSCRMALPTAILGRILPPQEQTALLLKQLRQEWETALPYQHEILLVLLQALLSRFARHTTEGRQIVWVSAKEQQILEKALLYFSYHLYHRVPLGEVAKHCGVKMPYLSALFQEYFGFRPQEYALRIRLEESCRLIREGNCNMAEIGEQLGFSSPQHFSLAFRKQFGCPPTVFAKQLP